MGQDVVFATTTNYRNVRAKKPPNKYLTATARSDNCTSPVLDAAFFEVEVAELPDCVGLVPDAPVVDETDWLAAVPLLPLANSVVEVVAPVELPAKEIDPNKPVVVDALCTPPDVLDAVALTLVLAGPSFSAPAVTPTGKNVISAGPSVDVTTWEVLYPWSVSLVVQTACVVPARLHATVSRGTLDERRTNWRVEGPSITVAPPP